jgi:hypothetical protein
LVNDHLHRHGTTPDTAITLGIGSKADSKFSRDSADCSLVDGDLITFRERNGNGLLTSREVSIQLPGAIRCRLHTIGKTSG